MAKKNLYQVEQVEFGFGDGDPLTIFWREDENLEAGGEWVIDQTKKGCKEMDLKLEAIKDWKKEKLMVAVTEYFHIL